MVLFNRPSLRAEAEIDPVKKQLEDRFSLSLNVNMPAPEERLRRLLADRDGIFDEPDRFGLLIYDRLIGRFDRPKNQSIGETAQPIIFVHGMLGSEATFVPMITAMQTSGVFKDVPVLAFRYPPTGSLARAGTALKNEIDRVCLAPANARFICHSAGGLVLRWYAEKADGRFDRAVLLGTPHRGSSMVRLRYWLDVPEHLGLPFDLPSTAGQLNKEREGQIFLDLEPDSLFLNHLGAAGDHAKRHRVVYGQFLSPLKAMAASKTFEIVRSTLRRKVEQERSLVLRRQGLAWLNDLRCPEEITHGDGCVSVKSAFLIGSNTIIATKFQHQELRSDSDSISRVFRLLMD